MTIDYIYDSNNNVIAYQFISSTFNAHNSNYNDTLYNTLPLNSGNDNNITLEFQYEYSSEPTGLYFELSLEGYTPYKATLDVYGSIITTADPTYADPVYDHINLEGGEFGLYYDYFPLLTQYPVITTILTVASGVSTTIYNEGYNEGESVGYSNGYSQGYQNGQTEANPIGASADTIGVLFDNVGNLLNYQIMPNISIGGILSIPIVLTGIVLVIKAIK